ncbi:MAG: amphi-Trp domain-containing protein [Desulfovibrio sp.]
MPNKKVIQNRVMDVDEVVPFLEEVILAIKDGTLIVDQGDEYISFSQPEGIEVSVKARQTAKKESYSLKLHWATKLSGEKAKRLADERREREERAEAAKAADAEVIYAEVSSKELLVEPAVEPAEELAQQIVEEVADEVLAESCSKDGCSLEYISPEKSAVASESQCPGAQTSFHRARAEQSELSQLEPLQKVELDETPDTLDEELLNTEPQDTVPSHEYVGEVIAPVAESEEDAEPKVGCPEVIDPEVVETEAPEASKDDSPDKKETTFSVGN